MVRCALNAVLDDVNLKNIDTSRVQCMREVGKSVLESVTVGERELVAFDAFSEEILVVLQSVTQVSLSNNAIKREKLWSRFHQACILQLPQVWKQLLSSLQVECSDDILQQSTNRKLFEMMLPSEFSGPTMQLHHNESNIQLSSDELNALQYACGYVPRALLRRYEKQTGPKFNQFVECLGEMAVDSSESEFLSYPKMDRESEPWWAVSTE